MTDDTDDAKLAAKGSYYWALNRLMEGKATAAEIDLRFIALQNQDLQDHAQDQLGDMVNELRGLRSDLKSFRREVEFGIFVLVVLLTAILFRPLS